MRVLIGYDVSTLKKEGRRAADVIVATATSYAKTYLAKKEFRALPKAVVYLIAVDSMDEYNRANLNGMKRYGTLTFERKNAELVLTANKLSFNP